MATGADIPRPRPIKEALPAARAMPRPTAPAPPTLTPDQVQTLLAKVEAGGMESLTPEELSAISRSVPASQGDALPEVSAPDLNDNLAASAIEIEEAPVGGAANLKPKKAKKAGAIEQLANEILQLTGESSRNEAIAPRQARATWRKIEALDGDGLEAVVAEIGNEDDALRRLEVVQELGQDATRDPNSLAAAALDRAKQAREGTMRAPGSESPEFATDTLSDADMPSPYDTAMAVERERQVDLTRRRAGSGMPVDPRLRLYYGSELVDSKYAAIKAAEDSGDEAAVKAAKTELAGLVRKLPLWLKGRDGRPNAMEVRARGDRGIESNDLKVLKDVIEANDLLRSASTPEQQAEALAMLAEAEAALERTYPSGRPAMPDSRLQSPDQQEILDDAVMAAVGFRPRAERNISRSSPTMSAADRASLSDEAAEAFGDMADEFTPDDVELNDVDELGGSGKPRKVRGRPLQSRVMSGLGTLFSDGRNPLSIPGARDTGIETFEDVAEEILSKQTVFKPGTEDYAMARERLVAGMEAKFGGASRGQTNEPSVTSQPSPGEERQFQPGLIPTNRITTDADGNPVYLNEADLPPPARQQMVGAQGREDGAALDVAGGRLDVDPEYQRALDQYTKFVRSKGYLQSAMSETLRDALGNPVAMDVSGVPVASRPAPPRSGGGSAPSPQEMSGSGLPMAPGSFAEDIDPNAVPVSRQIMRYDPATGTWVRSSLGGQRSSGPKPIQATVVGSVTNSGQVLPPAGQLALPGPKPLPSQVNLNSSATELEVAGDLPPARDSSATATPSTSGAGPSSGARKYTQQEIDDAAEQAAGEAHQQASEQGMDNPSAQRAARAAADKVRQDMGETPPPVADPTPAAKPGAAAKPAPDPADKGGKGSKGGRSKNAKPDAKKADDPKPKGDDPKKDAPPPPKSRLSTTAKVLGGVGLLTAGSALLSNMGGGSGNVLAGGPITVPPGSGAGGMGDAEAEADAITRALERIRGSRRNDGAGTTQVLQNWTGWR